MGAEGEPVVVTVIVIASLQVWAVYRHERMSELTPTMLKITVKGVVGQKSPLLLQQW